MAVVQVYMEKTSSRSVVPVVAVALLMLGFGAWQHLVFSLWAGEPAWFKNAYDEDTYILLANGLSGPRLDRMLSDGIAKLFLLMSGGSPAAALVGFDLVFPPLIFLAAYFLASRLFESISLRMVMSLLLMFSADLFSLGDSASYVTKIVSLEHFKAIIGLFGQNLVPPIETSYPTILRSPEPQVAYVVAFLFVGLLIQIVRAGGRGIRPAVWLAFTGAQLLLTLSYSLVSLPLLAVEAFAAFILLACRSFRSATVLAVFCALSLAAMVAAYAALDAEGSRVFASRLPTISVAVLGGLAAICLIGLVLWKRGFSDRMLWLAAAFAGVPVALMNQQLLTGMMISTRDWERYINHPALMIGLGILLSRLVRTADGAALQRYSRWAFAWAIVLLLIAFANLHRATTLWFPLNAKTLAMARAVDAAPGKLDGRTLVLDEPGLAPALAVRRDGRRDFLIDYTDVVLDWIPSLADAGFRLTPHGEALFEYWRLRGLTTEEVAEILEVEARERGGYYSAFFFNICDYWYPCTDNRAVQAEAIAAHLPEIVAAYERFREQPSDKFEGRRYAFISTTTAPVNGQIFDATPVSGATVGAATASVYLQK
jgi:hypothetical protein